MAETEKNSIDTAIQNIEKQITEHRDSTKYILYSLTGIGLTLIIIGVSIYIFQGYMSIVSIPKLRPQTIEETSPSKSTTKSPLNVTNKDNNQDTGQNSIPKKYESKADNITPNDINYNKILYEAISFFPDYKILYICFGLFVIIFGVLMSVYRFHLTEISRNEQYKLGLLRIRIAANNSNTEGFDSEVRTSLTQGAFEFSSGKEKNIESPLPGHPTSDFSTLFINKILDSMNVKLSSK